MAIAVALTLGLPELLAPMRFFFLWSAVLITAIVAGTGPALLASAISLLTAAYLIFDPLGAPDVHLAMDYIRLVLFGVFSTALSAVVGVRRRAEEHAASLNSRLLAEIQERRRHEENAPFINRASDLLATSLSYAETLRNVARLCVPALGDGCAVFIGSDENYECAETEHVDPAKRLQLEAFGRAARPAPEHDAIHQILRTRKPHLVAEISERGSVPNEQGELLHGLGFRSCVIVPMIARGRTLGALTLVYGDSGRRYAEHDVPLVEDLARRAAVAIDNARLYEAAEAANRAKDEFLATLSHELRTPLTAISGWAHMLDLGMTDEATTKLAISTIIRSAKAQAELIDDLLDLSRVVAGTLRLNVVDIDLAILIGEVVLAAKPAADARSIQLQVTTPPQPVMVRGDDRRLRQIVWNLVTNAVKFTDAGCVHVTLSAVGSNAHVEVMDTGRGIDASFLPHVWDRFRQADSSLSREFGGLGLGLAVVKHLAELHGGTVDAASGGLGQGSTFRVALPLARTTPAAAANVHSTHARLLTGRHVLVVEDDEDARVVLAAMLRRGGAEVTAAGCVAEAMQTFEKRPVDAVVSDIAMPGEDGYALVRRLHASCDVPVVAVSAIGTGPDDRKRALAAGFTEFLRKPVDPDELVAAVAALF